MATESESRAWAALLQGSDDWGVGLGGVREGPCSIIRDRRHAVLGQRRLPPSHPEAKAAGDKLAGL
jgi:hypothetical protein